MNRFSGIELVFRSKFFDTNIILGKFFRFVKKEYFDFEAQLISKISFFRPHLGKVDQTIFLCECTFEFDYLWCNL